MKNESKPESKSTEATIAAVPAYRLRPTGRGKPEAALASLCSPGQIGEPLIAEGVSKPAWNTFVLALVTACQAAGMSDDDIVANMNTVDAGNASASRQNIESLAMSFPVKVDGKPVLIEADDPAKGLKKGDPTWGTEHSVGAFWARAGIGAAKANLAGLDKILRR
jgi:hypothetical protein